MLTSTKNYAEGNFLIYLSEIHYGDIRTPKIVTSMNGQIESNRDKNWDQSNDMCLHFKTLNQINDGRCDNEELHIHTKIPRMHLTLKEIL